MAKRLMFFYSSIALAMLILIAWYATQTRYTYLKPVLIVVPQVPLPYINPPVDNLDEYTRLLHSLENDKSIGDQARTILVKMPWHQRQVQQMLSSAQGMHIDFVGNIHSTEFTPSARKETVDILGVSQQYVLDIIDQEQFDIVGVEGGWYEPLTFETYIKIIEETAVPQGISQAEHEQTLNASIAYDQDKSWAYSFLKNNKGRATGIEDKDIHRMHVTAKYIYSGIMPDVFLQSGFISSNAIKNGLTYETRVKCGNVFQKFVRLRSIIAVCRIIDAMKMSGTKHGAIVMGKDHESDFIVIAKVAGMHSKIFRALPKEVGTISMQ